MPRLPERGPNSAETRKSFFDPQRDVTQFERDGLQKRLEELRTSYPPGRPYEYFADHAALMAILGEKPDLTDEDRKGLRAVRHGFKYTPAEHAASMVLIGEKVDFSIDDQKNNEQRLKALVEGHAWVNVSELAVAMTILGQSPNLEPKVIEKLQLDLDSHWYEAETFYMTGNPERAAKLAANLTILGTKPLISPNETAAALGVKTDVNEQQWKQLNTWLKDYRMGRRGAPEGSFPTELATAMTVLAAEKIEVPPEGGLILDGRRIGPSPERSEGG